MKGGVRVCCARCGRGSLCRRGLSRVVAGRCCVGRTWRRVLVDCFRVSRQYRCDAEERGKGQDTHMSRTTSSAGFLGLSSPVTWFFLRRASRWPMTRLTWANLRVFFCTPMVAEECVLCELNSKDVKLIFRGATLLLCNCDGQPFFGLILSWVVQASCRPWAWISRGPRFTHSSRFNLV